MDPPLKSKTVKLEFGERFRIKRKQASLSREELARTVGISPKTLKNWEDGKTFVEDLGVIEPIEKASGIYIPALLDEAIRAIAKRSRTA
jgi:transcriptional regulator with XRE-family HTH domain